MVQRVYDTVRLEVLRYASENGAPQAILRGADPNTSEPPRVCRRLIGLN